MTWTRTFDLHVDVNKHGRSGSPLLAIDGDAVTDGPIPTLIQGDVFGIRLFFWNRTSAGVETIQLPAGSNIVFAGITTSNLGVTLLFLASAFSEAQDDDDNYYYSATLDLSSSTLAEAIGSESSLSCLADIEVQDAGDLTRLTFQFRMSILRQVYTGTDAMLAGVYPGSLVVEEIVAGQKHLVFRNSDGVEYLRLQPPGA